MKVTLKPVTSYEVTINGVPVEGTFARESTWNGLVNLVDAKSGRSIVMTDSDFASPGIMRMLNPAAEFESSIIMASPDIAAMAKEPLTVSQPIVK